MDSPALIDSTLNLVRTHREISVALGVALGAYLLLRPKQGFRLLGGILIAGLLLYLIVLFWGALANGIEGKMRMGHKTEDALK